MLMILGVSASIKPYALDSINIVDYGVAILAAVLTWVVVFTFGKRKFDRIEGVIFLAIYIGYTTYLLMR
jgi:cation:H+ antiporter